ncbi:hypothetical protein P872_17980 [Rhodonellum psychrophilum GCM71 = DSM 17998]|uniref:Uncharacterized protein n=1 Tax=Rhodonellum psychrophilum GCM71 = DSM 17998 TaxID=1123057 RepID=U5BX30_9BACT|nr:hypothetical protein P872_17980 [Rhodonellum psychrophilum GCM71 = DSM 17998]
MKSPADNPLFSKWIFVSKIKFYVKGKPDWNIPQEKQRMENCNWK